MLWQPLYMYSVSKLPNLHVSVSIMQAIWHKSTLFYKAQVCGTFVFVKASNLLLVFQHIRRC